ncbi:UNVERIFIED_CONTAM: hypothetical protein HDU68_002442 [Siphonaria sp. JEL0065]|nr:hypothetical protein HDU68_002442 [Siphonaria sp. JEL0065]
MATTAPRRQIHIWDLPFLVITPILLYVEDLSEFFIANKQIHHNLAKNPAIRSFWLHKQFNSVCAALGDVLSPESATSILNNEKNTTSCIDAYPLGLLNLENVVLNLLQTLENKGRKDLWDIIIVVASRWGHYRVLDRMFKKTRKSHYILDSDVMIQKAVETAIAYAQIEFMTRLLTASNRMQKVPIYLHHAIQMDRPKSVAHLLSILREFSQYTSTLIAALLQEAVIGGKFKSLSVLLNDISLLDRESWLHLVSLASAGGSHSMISLILKTGELLDGAGRYNGSDVESYEQQGWGIAMDCAIQRGRPTLAEYLLNISIQLKTVKVKYMILNHLEMSVREGQTSIIWVLLDSPQSIIMANSAELATGILKYYALQYEKDTALCLDKEAVKNIRGRDTRGVLPIFRGLITQRKAKFSAQVGRSLLLMAITWNLSATYEFLEDSGACLGDSVEPIIECLLRIIQAPQGFEFPNWSLVMKLVNHPPTRSQLFGYKEGLLLRTLALPQSRAFLKKGSQLWECAVKLTPVSVLKRSDQFLFVQ